MGIPIEIPKGDYQGLLSKASEALGVEVKHLNYVKDGYQLFVAAEQLASLPDGLGMFVLMPPERCL